MTALSRHPFKSLVVFLVQNRAHHCKDSTGTRDGSNDRIIYSRLLTGPLCAPEYTNDSSLEMSTSKRSQLQGFELSRWNWLKLPVGAIDDATRSAAC